METPVKKDEKQSKRSKLWISAVGVVVILFLTFAFSPQSSLKLEKSHATSLQNNKVVSSDVREGIVSITTEWYGFVVPTGYRLSGTLMTKDTWWEVRVNKGRLYTLPPINQSTGTVNTGTDTAYKEYRIKSGQERTSGELAYVFEKLK